MNEHASALYVSMQTFYLDRCLSDQTCACLVRIYVSCVEILCSSIALDMPVLRVSECHKYSWKSLTGLTMFGCLNVVKVLWINTNFLVFVRERQAFRDQATLSNVQGTLQMFKSWSSTIFKLFGNSRVGSELDRRTSSELLQSSFEFFASS